MPEEICQECAESFTPSPRANRRGGGWFCSLICSGRHWGRQSPRPPRHRSKRICESCGKEFETRPFEVKRGGGRFCSHDCAWMFGWTRPVKEQTCLACGITFKTSTPSSQRFCSDYCRTSYSPPKRPRQDGQVETTCEHCGRRFRVEPSFLKRGHGRFCSAACCGAHRDTRVLVNCDFCGTGFRTRPKRPQRFCSKQCQSKGSRGGNNPTWMGGISFEPYGLEFDDSLREQIRRRDNYTCQICGFTQNGRAHSVHHINYHKKDNRPENLVTLCVQCHGKTTTERGRWVWHFTVAPQFTSRVI